MIIGIWGEDNARGYQYENRLPWNLGKYWEFIRKMLKDQVLVSDYHTFLSLKLQPQFFKKVYLIGAPREFIYSYKNVSELQSYSHVKNIRKDIYVLCSVYCMTRLIPYISTIVRLHVNGQYLATSTAEPLDAHLRAFEPVVEEDFIDFKAYIYQRKG